MANIITNSGKHDKFGKTRSEHEENMRKEWGHTMTDDQLDKLKFFEKRRENNDGSTKNFATGIDIDRMDGADRMDGCVCKKTCRRDKSGVIISMTDSEKYSENYDLIDWK